METIFKVGDKVFDYQFGWGEVISSIGHLSVKFGMSKASYNQAGCRAPSSIPTLSFTEYTLRGFSQKRPIDYNDYIRRWGKFWDNGWDAGNYVINRLVDYSGLFEAENGSEYENFTPLTEEQIKILEL